MRKIREQDSTVHRAWLRELRIKKGWTMVELAEKVEVTSEYIGNLERGQRNPSAPLAIKLSEILKFPVKKLYEDALPREERIIAKKKAQ